MAQPHPISHRWNSEQCQRTKSVPVLLASTYETEQLKSGIYREENTPPKSSTVHRPEQSRAEQKLIRLSTRQEKRHKSRDRSRTRGLDPKRRQVRRRPHVAVCSASPAVPCMHPIQMSDPISKLLRMERSHKFLEQWGELCSLNCRSGWTPRWAHPLYSTPTPPREGSTANDMQDRWFSAHE